MLNPLEKKLFRDLWKLRGQVLAVAMVIASGVATLVMSLSTIEALEETTAAYYQRYRFGDVFASATRVPDTMASKIAEIPGVQAVQTRISSFATIDIEGFAEPVVGRMISIPENRQPLLSRLVLRKGDWVSVNADDEVIINEPFAEAHNLEIGDQLQVIMRGHKRKVRIVGIALCPEFIYALGPGSLLPDDKRFGVLWMNREALAAAYELEESFNDVTLSLAYQAQAAPVMQRLDQLLAPYGGNNAIPRADQLSNWFVMNEIEQQKTMATILPTIFIAVAIFLTNMVLARLIATERTEIGLLKAFGYSKWQIALHYTKMMLVISLLGILLGSLMGVIFGRMNTELYAELFRFPLLIYQPGFHSFAIGALISVAASLAGALSAVNKALSMPPAEAMIPPSPPVYKNSRLASSAIGRFLDQPTRIALRQIERWPIRSLMTSAGIGLSVGLVVMSLQWDDSLNHIARVYFYEAQRQDVMVGLTEPRSRKALHNFTTLPGVMRAEPMRMISVEFQHNTITHRGALSAIEPQNQLYPIFDDVSRSVQTVPDSGVVLASRLAKKLDVDVGDELWVEVLQGRRPTLPLKVVDIIETYIGMPAYINLEYMNRLLKEGQSFEYANLLIDPAKQPLLFEKLKSTPNVSSVMIKQAALEEFEKTLIEHLMVFISMFSTLAAVLGFGVAYNSTRIALSERGRELATLRVLGFTRKEISYVLLGEVMMLILVGLGMGCFIGLGLVWSMASSFDTELFRIPLIIENSTYGSAVMVILVATFISAALVRNRVDKLDLIRVLKTRE